MFEHHNAFIDEHGNENLDLTVLDVSSYFIITAVIVDDEGISMLEPSVDSIRKVHFQTGEMKSSAVGNNHQRRSRVLGSLASTGLKYATLVINKAEIHKESGLQYKKSFRKFLSNILYNRLFRTFPNLTIICDKHGSKSFMSSFKAYVETNKKESLFEKQLFEFVESKSNVLVQSADLISGTWAKILDPTIDIAFRDLWRSQISKSAIFVDFWPPSGLSPNLSTK